MDREMIVYSSPITDRTSLFKKSRHLFLTDYSRLLCIKEHRTSVKVKHQISVGAHRAEQASGKGKAEAAPDDLELLQEVEAESAKVFRVTTVRCQ